MLLNKITKRILKPIIVLHDQRTVIKDSNVVINKISYQLKRENNISFIEARDIESNRLIKSKTMKFGQTNIVQINPVKDLFGNSNLAILEDTNKGRIRVFNRFGGVSNVIDNIKSYIPECYKFIYENDLGEFHVISKPIKNENLIPYAIFSADNGKVLDSFYLQMMNGVDGDIKKQTLTAFEDTRRIYVLKRENFLYFSTF